MNKNIYIKWLLADSIITIIAGLFIAFLKDTALFHPMGSGINVVFWPNGLTEFNTILFRGFTYSIIGAVMASMGLQILFIIKFALSKKEKWSWYCILISLLLWFVIDESFSLYYSVYFNTIFNVIFLALFLIPLILIKKEF